MVQVATALAGGGVAWQDISARDEQIARELVAKKLGGGRVPMTGTSAAVRERYGELLTASTRGEALKGGAISSSYKPSEREIRAQKLEAAYQQTSQAELIASRGAVDSKFLMTTKQGVVDTRTGRVVTPSQFISKQQLAKASESFMTTERGIVDTRTGRVVASSGTSPRQTATASQRYNLKEFKESISSSAQPRLEQRQVDTFKRDGKTIPITEIFYVVPTTFKDGKLIPGETRKATSEEREMFKSGTRTLQASGDTAPSRIRQKVTETWSSGKGVYFGIQGNIVSGITSPTFEFVSTSSEKYLGVDILGKEFQSAYGDTLVGVGPFPVSFGSDKVRSINVATKEFYGGISYNILQDVKEKPIKQVALIGLGAGIGFGSSALIGGATAIAPAVGTVTKVGVAGAGLGLTGLYGVKIVGQVSSATSPFEIGGILGVTAKDLVLVGVGGRIGQKGYQKFEGGKVTRGRSEISLEQLTQKEVVAGTKTFPTAPTYKHLSLFQKGATGKVIGETPGAFHASPSRFGKGGITPSAGTSELAGLYGGSYVSPYFSGVKGPTGQYKLFGFDFGGKPGLAYLKPEGFRIGKWVKVGGKYKWFGEKYKWVGEAKPGYADVPLMKTEIEAIFRPDAGSYSLESGKYYTVIKDVRVPIDVFKYDASIITGDVVGGPTLVGGSGSSYSGVPSTSLFTPSTTALGFGISSSKKTSVSSYTLTPSYSPSVISSSKIKPKSSATSSYKIKPKSSLKGFSLPSYKSVSKSKSVAPLLVSSYKPAQKKKITSLISYVPPSTSSYSVPSKRKSKKGLIRGKKSKRREPSLQTYGVQVRRFGKFKPIGKGLTFAKAVEIGRVRTGRTLAATFKLTPEFGKTARGLRTPKGFRRKVTPTGVEFIELRKFRLSTRPETKEIQFFKRSKPKKKKKSGKRKKKK